MLNMENWSPELKGIYQKKYPGGQAPTEASPVLPSEPSMAQPDGVLGRRTLGQAAGPSLGMPIQAPRRVRREVGLTPPASPPPSMPVMAPQARDATVDQNAQAVLNPPAGATNYTPLQGRFQQIDTEAGYTDDLSAFEPIYQQWKDHYERTGKHPNKDSQWPARMQAYYDAWFRHHHTGPGSVEDDPNAPVSTPSFFQEMDDYFQKLKLAQRDDPNYVRAGGSPINPSVRQAIPGVYPEAMQQYKSAKFTPEEQKFMMQEMTPGIQSHRTAQQEGQDIANDLSGGQYDVGDLMSPGVEAQTTGKLDSTAYDPVLKHAMDSVIDRYQRAILPGISDEAQTYGQYGGSRQGVAEGLATQGLEKTLGEMSARMNLGAYTDAQSRVIPATQARAGLKKGFLADRLSHRRGALSQRAANTQESDDYINRMLKYWRHGTDNDADALKRYLSMLQLGSPGPSTTQTQPQFRNKTAETLGMIGSLASLFVG